MNMFRSRAPWIAAALMTMVAAGCGDGREKKDIAPTEGTVMCEGQPVPFVSVFFEPLNVGKNANVGKQAIGYCDDKGHFVLSTYDTDDGAVVGKHRVRVGRPLGEPRPNFKCDCALSESIDVMEVDIAAGKTTTIEGVLKKATRADKAAEARATARDKED